MTLLAQLTTNTVYIVDFLPLSGTVAFLWFNDSSLIFCPAPPCSLICLIAGGGPGNKSSYKSKIAATKAPPQHNKLAAETPSPRRLQQQQQQGQGQGQPGPGEHGQDDQKNPENGNDSKSGSSK